MRSSRKDPRCNQNYSLGKRGFEKKREERAGAMKIFRAVTQPRNVQKIPPAREKHAGVKINRGDLQVANRQVHTPIRAPLEKNNCVHCVGGKYGGARTGKYIPGT